MSQKILFSNLGYARGINGGLAHYVLYGHRYLYCSRSTQEETLEQLRAVIHAEEPDICCLVEVDRGAANSAHFNQLEHLINDTYNFFDIENKYAQKSWLRDFHFTKGKSNAFVAKSPYPHEKINFSHGVKTLVYKVKIAPEVTLFFSHFSLNQKTRTKQLEQVGHLIDAAQGEVIFMGDFNVLNGLRELDPLLSQKNLVLLNDHNTPTFTFHRRKLVLDLCICSKGIAEKAQLKVIPQSYSDHAALLLTL